MEAQLAAAKGDETAVALRSVEANKEKYAADIAAAKAAGDLALAKQLEAKAAIQEQIDNIAAKKSSASYAGASSGSYSGSGGGGGETDIVASEANAAANRKADFEKRTAELETALLQAKGDQLAIAQNTAKTNADNYDKQIKAANAQNDTALATQLQKEKGLQAQIDAVAIAKEANAIAERTKSLDSEILSSKETLKDLEAQLAAAKGDEAASAKRTAEVNAAKYDAAIKEAKSQLGGSQIVANLMAQKSVQAQIDQLAIDKATPSKNKVTNGLS